MDINLDLLQQFINVLIKSEVLSNEQLVEVHKPNFENENENLKNEKYTRILKTIFGWADLADMQLTSKYNKGFRLLLCVIDIYSKYERHFPFKDKKVQQLLTLFKKCQMSLIANQRKQGKIKIDL